jgi:hypothetical protein
MPVLLHFSFVILVLWLVHPRQIFPVDVQHGGDERAVALFLRLRVDYGLLREQAGEPQVDPGRTEGRCERMLQLRVARLRQGARVLVGHTQEAVAGADFQPGLLHMDGNLWNLLGRHFSVEGG